jgi:hypothetical protein
MAQASFVIIEVAECATIVEIEGIFWYHVVRSFSPEMGENKMGSTPCQVCCPYAVQMEWSFGCAWCMRQRWGGARI